MGYRKSLSIVNIIYYLLSMKINLNQFQNSVCQCGYAVNWGMGGGGVGNQYYSLFRDLNPSRPKGLPL